MNIRVNEKMDMPIYQQIVVGITGEIKNGRLEYGQQLPTVRQLAEDLKIAKGTVKKAYDELEATGVISKARGKGTFVSWQEETIQSRKDRAMAAIDHMLDMMEGMRFSSAEISIFLDLKMRERAQRERLLTIAAVECCRETQSMLVRSLYELTGTEVFRKDLYECLSYPEGLSASVDLVVTTATHYEQVAAMVGEERTLTAVMELSPESIAGLARLGKGRLGIFAASEKFAALARTAAAKYASQTRFAAVKLTEDSLKLEDLLRNVDILAVPAGIERICSSEEERQIRSFAKEHPLVEIGYRVDEGSMRYLARQVRDIQMVRKR